MTHPPEGIYDNTATRAREVYHTNSLTGDTKLVQHITADLILTKTKYGGLAGLVPDFGYYPDIPREEARE